MGNPVMMAVSVGSTLLSAKLQRDAYEAEAQASKEQGEMAQIEAEQQENVRRGQLLQMMSALNASEASRGLTVATGGTGSALRESEKKFAEADISSIKLMGLSKRRQYSLGAKQAKLSGQASVLSGITSAGSTYRRYKIDKGDWKIKGQSGTN
tara:strand:- start:1953 stop:2411 length:459 start_codon:yes stop_codon:yes gene_type:complete